MSNSQIVTLYRSGLTTYEVAERIGVCQATVVNRLKQAGESRRTRWQHYATMSREEAVACYLSGIGSVTVAKRAGVTPRAVIMAVHEAGHPTRHHSEYPARRGSDNPSWRGGRSTCNRSGYVSVNDNGKRRPEHRVVVENAIGRKLSRDEIVHHMNGIRDDNRIKNLTVTTLKDHEHGTYIKALQKRIKHLESLIR